MSTINKIICDICGKEIDVANDKAIALFKNIKVQKAINPLSSMSMPQNNLKVEDKINETSYDICFECVEPIENYIIKLKNEKYINIKK